MNVDIQREPEEWGEYLEFPMLEHIVWIKGRWYKISYANWEGEVGDEQVHGSYSTPT